ncbi:kynureninase [Pendulispora rubella]|uniref:Kynureninase n=1 Tax=Pendulispora rubella TaxID=2741070 RepID=A0ABZ2L159_9BACT
MSARRDDALARDEADPLARFRERFDFGRSTCIYLDGNSLGRPPRAAIARIRRAMEDEWAGELVAAWDHWIELAREAGDLLAGIVGAAPGEVVVSDSTSVNLYKLAAAALDARPERRVIVTDDDNFPTDRYILEGLAQDHGLDVRSIRTDIDEGVTLERVKEALGPDVALLSLSHVAYRSGAIADMKGITAAAHEAGALVLWDLCHSAGAVPVDLAGAGVDLAVGCTYKHLNAGPGAPAFLHVRADLQASLRQPIWGWFGQRDQFDMGPAYQPADAVERFLAGTPPVLSLYGVLEGARLTAEAGMPAIYDKARALTSYAVLLFDAWLAPLGFRLASPRDEHARGAHVTLEHPEAWRLCRAWKDAGTIPDFRTPDRLRIGVAPLYTRYVDLHDGLSRLRDLAASKAYEAYPKTRSRVT